MANEYLNNKKFEGIIDAFQTFKKHKSRHELILKDIQETHERRHHKYKDTKRQEIVKKCLKQYEEVCQNFKIHQEQLAYAFYILAENIANYTKFTGVDPDDATQEGVLICFEKVDRFNKKKGKAFNFFSTVSINALRQIYRGIQNYNNLKKKYHNHLCDKLKTSFLSGKYSKYKQFFDLDNNE